MYNYKFSSNKIPLNFGNKLLRYFTFEKTFKNKNELSHTVNKG